LHLSSGDITDGYKVMAGVKCEEARLIQIDGRSLASIQHFKLEATPQKTEAVTHNCL
jgi:hypothetical protein